MFPGSPPPPARVLAVVVAVALLGMAAPPLSAQGVPSFYEPGVSPDGSEIAFVSGGDIWTVPSEGGAARLLVAHSAHESRPLYSPDGSTLAFNSNRHGGVDVFLLDLESGEVRRLTHDSGSQELTGWSADSEWEGELERVTDFRDGRLLWPSMSADGSTIAFERNLGIWVLDVNTSFSVGQVLLSPDGESGVLTGDGALHRITFGPNGDVDIDRMEVGGNPISFSADGRHLYVSQRGELRVVSVPGGQARTVETSVSWDEDFDATRVPAFEQAWAYMRDGFYDPDMHGVDWEAVRDRFRPFIEGARTRTEFSRLMNLMLGELNASHLGHSGRTGPPRGGDGASTGRLGLRFDRHAYEGEGWFVVREVVELGPADIAGGIAPGDELVSLDGAPLEEGTDLHLRLRDAAGRRVVVGVRSGGGDPREVELLATSGGAERQLLYRNWVEGRRACVEELSGGRLGYVHIASMSAGALDQFIFDLDQQNHAKDGVVIDVRNNNGGFVNVYAIDILNRPNYFTMQSRGSQVAAPSRARLGQRALLAPTVLVTNKHTLSDGEDFTEGYRALGLGQVVGEPTAGWIIFTGSRGLVDGTSIRMPGTFIRDNRGQNMELNPRPVDVAVEWPTGEWYRGRDSQLEAAVEVLLGQIERAGVVGGDGG